jgi:hypothetical protein
MDVGSRRRDLQRDGGAGAPGATGAASGASDRTRSDTASLSCSARRGLLRHFPDAPGGTKIDYLLSSGGCQ